MGHLLQKFFHMLGGTAIWLLSNFMNLVFSKNYKSHIGHYLYEDIEYPNKSSLDSKKITFVTGIGAFVLIITILEHYN